LFDEDEIPENEIDIEEIVVCSIEEQEQIADMNNRISSELRISELAIADHIKDQNSDDDLKWLKALVIDANNLPLKLETENPKRKNYVKLYEKLNIIGDNLYVQSEDKCGQPVLLYMVPQKEITTVIRQLHDSVLSGH
jgi:hypothetical protein